MSVTSEKTKIIYIGGYSRSGSTLLLRLLGECPDITAAGELFDVWERSYIQNQLCGCGLGFGECPFWIDVSIRAFECKPHGVSAGRYNEMRSRVQGRSRIPMLWLPELRSGRYRRQLRGYAEILEKLYAAVREVSDSEVIVDSSKVPQYAWILSEAAGIELHVVHLVRDSRATAFSWQRQRMRPEITSKISYMDTHSVFRSACEWNLFNYLLSSRSGSYASYTLIRYEDLVADPRGELQKVVRVLRGAVPLTGLANGAQVSLGLSHTASGNPGRFQVGDIGMAEDAEWVQAMSISRRLMATALTARGLTRYGYPLLRSH